MQPVSGVNHGGNTARSLPPRMLQVLVAVCLSFACWPALGQLTSASPAVVYDGHPMGLLGTVLRVGAPEKTHFIQPLIEMADEQERTYLGMLDVYNQDVAQGLLPRSASDVVKPTTRGIFKARLLGALYSVAAFAKSGGDQDDYWELLEAASGMARMRAGDPTPRVEHEEAVKLFDDFALPALKAINAALDIWPRSPSQATAPEHEALADLLHSALVESIGANNYTADVRARFDSLVIANTAVALNHISKWVE